MKIRQMLFVLCLALHMQTAQAVQASGFSLNNVTVSAISSFVAGTFGLSLKDSAGNIVVADPNGQCTSGWGIFMGKLSYDQTAEVTGIDDAEYFKLLNMQYTAAMLAGKTVSVMIVYDSDSSPSTPCYVSGVVVQG